MSFSPKIRKKISLMCSNRMIITKKCNSCSNWTIIHLKPKKFHCEKKISILETRTKISQNVPAIFPSVAIHHIYLAYVNHLVSFSANGGVLVWDIFYWDLGTGEGYKCLFTYRGWAGKFKTLTFWCQVGWSSWRGRFSE